MRKNRSMSLVFFCALVCFFAAIDSGCTKRETAAAHVLRLSQRNEPSNLDPAAATLADEFAILRALSEGLLIPGAHGEPLPGAATRFEVSSDGLVYTFHLRTNARWSDGRPVTAQDFVASYRRMLTPATAAVKANVFYPVKNAQAFVTGALTDFSAVGFRAPNPHTLVVTLERPTPRFPYYVLSGPWLPVRVDVVEAHGRAWNRPEHFVGNGPFVLTEWRQDQRIVVRKNPLWHDAAHVRLDEIQFLRIDSADGEDRAFRAGQADATMAVPVSKVEAYTQERPAELQRAPMIETRYFSFNTQRPPLDDPRVRRALALALDRRRITERVLRGGQEPAGRFVPSALRRETNAANDDALPLSAEHRYDPDAARRLLAESGVTAKDFPRLELTAWSSSQAPVLEAAQQMWRQELGLDFTIGIREARVHWDALKTGSYDIAFVSAIPDVADVAQMLGDFTSGATENYPHWSDRGYDEAFARAVALSEPAARSAAFATAEQRLLDAAALTPLYFNTKIWLMSPRVHGWQEDGLWTRCYQQIHVDEK